MMTFGLKRNVLLLLCVASVLLSGCVSQGKYDDLQSQNSTLQEKNNIPICRDNTAICRANINSCSSRLRHRRRKVPRTLPP